MMRNGISAASASASFTPQSATARLTHNGIIDPTPSIGKTSPAQLTSLPGSMNVSAAEKAIVKKIAVSRIEPIRVETNGAPPPDATA